MAYYGPFKSLDEIYNTDLNALGTPKQSFNTSDVISSRGQDVTKVFKLENFTGDVGDYYVMGLFNGTRYWSNAYDTFAGNDFYEGPNKGDMTFTIKDVGTRNSLSPETPAVVVDNETPNIESCSGVDVAIDMAFSNGFDLSTVIWTDIDGNVLTDYTGKDVATITELVIILLLPKIHVMSISLIHLVLLLLQTQHL